MVQTFLHFPLQFSEVMKHTRLPQYLLHNFPPFWMDFSKKMILIIFKFWPLISITENSESSIFFDSKNSYFLRSLPKADKAGVKIISIVRLSVQFYRDENWWIKVKFHSRVEKRYEFNWEFRTLFCGNWNEWGSLKIDDLQRDSNETDCFILIRKNLNLS